MLMCLIVYKSNLKELQVNQRTAGNCSLLFQNELQVYVVVCCDFNSCLRITGIKLSSHGGEICYAAIVHYIDLLQFSSQ